MEFVDRTNKWIGMRRSPKGTFTLEVKAAFVVKSDLSCTVEEKRLSDLFSMVNRTKSDQFSGISGENFEKEKEKLGILNSFKLID